MLDVSSYGVDVLVNMLDHFLANNIELEEGGEGLEV